MEYLEQEQIRLNLEEQEKQRQRQEDDAVTTAAEVEAVAFASAKAEAAVAFAEEAVAADPDLPRLSRDDMHQLKARKDEEIRQEIINNAVRRIYKGAVQAAQNEPKTRYKHDLKMTLYQIQSVTTDETCKKNIETIVSRVKALFPGCGVEQTSSGYLSIDWT